MKIFTLKNTSLLFLMLFQLLCLNVSSQSFETYIKHQNNEYPLYNSVSLDNNQYIVGTRISNQSNTNIVKTVLYKLDSLGNKIDSLEVPFSINDIIEHNNVLSFVGSDITIANTNLLIFGEIGFQGGLDTNSVKSITTPYDYAGVFQHSFMDYCDCYVGVGSVSDSNNFNKGYVVQWDTNMNLIRQKYYPAFYSPVVGYPWFNNVIESLTEEGILVLAEPIDSTSQWRGGAAAVIPMDSTLVRDSTNLHLLVSDSAYKFMSGNVAITPQPFDGIQLTDSTYLFAGRIFTERYVNGNLVGFEDDLAYTVTDTAFNSVKWHFFGKGGNNVPDDTMDVGGFSMVDRYGHHVYIGSVSDFQFGFFLNYDNVIGITKVDLNGNHLWTKYYQNGNYIMIEYSITATKDGGALVVAASYDANKGTGNEYDLYILKVDSNGNKITVGIEEREIIEKYDYSVYPNPASDQLNFRKFNYFMPYKVRLFDTFGREVMRFNWLEDQKTVSIADLASGVYIYRISDGKGRMASGKVVVE